MPASPTAGGRGILQGWFVENPGRERGTSTVRTYSGRRNWSLTRDVLQLLRASPFTTQGDALEHLFYHLCKPLQRSGSYHCGI